MRESSPDGRPKPPYHLTTIQKRIWRDVVSSEPAPYFDSPANQLLLVEFTRHSQSASFLATAIENIESAGNLLEPKDARTYAKLLQLRESATRCLASIATKLRLTNQSRYTPQAAATASKNTGSGSKPWDDDL